MSDEVISRHGLAEKVAAEAAELALDFFNRRNELLTEAKASPQDVVSEADRKVEILIRQRILETFPNDGLLGEEHGLASGTSGFTWVIDPIDGTSPFLAGLPHWCIALALVFAGQTVAAVTHVPMAQEVYSARMGHGAWLNGKALRLDGQATIQNALTGIGASHHSDPDHIAGVISNLLQAGGAFYRNGSGAIMLAAVSAGRLGAYYEPHMNCWDCLGGILMVKEAGGKALAFGSQANPLTGGPVLVTAPLVWDAMVEIIELPV